MADSEINEKLKNVRTMEDIVNLLSILFTNLNNQSEQYYDMFWNPEPMDLELEKYDENGKLITVIHPNVAKMRISTFTGAGSPNGVVAASIGSLYIDLNSQEIYYKAAQDGKTFGWQLIWSSINFREGDQYLAPNGDGSELQNLNANSIGLGILKVTRGGTGTNTITGLVKGNGTAPFTAAVVDQDYLAPSSFTGLIMYCPTAVIPDGWLVCDGTIYNVSLRPELTRLLNKLGNKYGGNGTTTFGVPNLIEKYIKCGVPADVGTEGDAHVGAHTHQVTGSTKEGSGAHTHDRGTMNITGDLNIGSDYPIQVNGVGAFIPYNAQYGTDIGGSLPAYAYRNLSFSADRSWVGRTSSEPHQHEINLTISSNEGTNEVDHIVMVPIIKY